MKKFKIVKMQMGHCPCCNHKTIFIANDYWLRDHYHCLLCRSIPRQRAIMKVLKFLVPQYVQLKIHESSPSGITFKVLKECCQQYSYSYFYEDKVLGENLDDNCTNQNLENLTFDDAVFDVFITQDVFEHVDNPTAAFQNIERVLKPGGFHIFTVPLYPFKKTRPRIEIKEGKRKLLLPAIYHGNPIDSEGSLVTYDWGGDIVTYIDSCTKMKTEIIEFLACKENFENGLEANFLQVIVSKKLN